MSDPRTGLAMALADRYRLERELGQGGMATVYLAQALKHDQCRAQSPPTGRGGHGSQLTVR